MMDLRLGDCLEILPTLADNSVDLIATDPPYFRVKDEDWDRQWSDADRFIVWIGQLCQQWQRVLKPNGSLYVFASPKMAARVEIEIARWFNVLNRITWRKHDGTENEGGLWSRADKDTLRCFFEQKEEIIFAEHFGADNIAKGEAGYEAKCDELRGFVFEPLRRYLDEERKRAVVNFDQVRQIVGCAPGSGLPSHWFTRSQWMLPTREAYEKLRAGFSRLDHGGDYLRREYDDLRREYDDLRRPFRVTPDVPYTDVWSFATVQAYPGKHPAEKPIDLMKHIIRTSSRPGATVLDSCMWSGTTGKAAQELGRDFIGIEKSPVWFERARTRIETVQLDLFGGTGA